MGKFKESFYGKREERVQDALKRYEKTVDMIMEQREKAKAAEEEASAEAKENMA